MKKIFFIGLGKLGLSLAALLSKKNRVVGYDYNKKHIYNLKKNNFSNLEKDISSFLKKNNSISYTDNLSEINKQQFDFIYILIPTNQSISGNYDSSNLVKLILNVIKINKIKKDISIVICSTLQPGTYNKSLKRIESLYSINFFYCPEFVALGDTINGFINPDILLIGGQDKRKIDSLEKIHTSFSIPKNISKLTFQGAELVKLAVNSYVCTKISFANLISQICDKNKIPNSTDVVKSIGFDSRIGNKFFKSGPPFGGLCFPKDVEAFFNLCSGVGININLIKGTKEINQDQKKLFLNKLKKFIKENNVKKLGVIGLSFKEDTMTLEESQYVEVLNYIKNVDFEIYDLSKNIQSLFKFCKVKKLNDVIEDNDYLLVNHTKPNFINIINKSKSKIIFSPWKIDLNKKHKVYSF